MIFELSWEVNVFDAIEAAVVVDGEVVVASPVDPVGPAPVGLMLPVY